MSSTGVQDNLASVRRRIEAACRRGGRPTSAVTVIGVTKTVPVERIEDAIAAGLTEFGENRVQEAREKTPRLATRHPTLRWHCIGALQRNKAKQAVELFHVIHSVEALSLAEELERHAAALGRSIEVLVQVNVSGEVRKHGCRPEDVPALAVAVSRCAHLRLIGLMTIPPWAEEPEASRPLFRQLGALRETLNLPLKLSMGMSNDFEVAIEEGADYIRLGTAIFGPR